MANQTTPHYIGAHEVAAGAKDAAAPAYNSANAPLKNSRYDKYLSVFVEITGGAGPVAITVYSCNKNAIAPANGFGLLGTTTIAHGGGTFSQEYPLFCNHMDIGFFVDNVAGAAIISACSIKVLAASDRG